MKYNMIRGMALAAGVVFVGATTASAAVAWNNPSGSAAFFSWANGQNSNTNLFGSPIITGGDTFVFFPQSFNASATNGASVTATDTFEVDLFAQSGFGFTAIRIQQFGTYELTGAGSVEANALMDISDLLAPRAEQASMTSPNGFPIATAGTGNWQGTTQVPLLGANGWTQIHLTFTSNLISISTPGGTAFIGNDVLGAPVALTIIPAPAAVSLLSLAGLAAVRRRR